MPRPQQQDAWIVSSIQSAMILQRIYGVHVTSVKKLVRFCVPLQTTFRQRTTGVCVLQHPWQPASPTLCAFVTAPICHVIYGETSQFPSPVHRCLSRFHSIVSIAALSTLHRWCGRAICYSVAALTSPCPPSLLHIIMIGWN